MNHTPSPRPCPPYVPATQITPDSIDDVPTQENSLFTQESRRISFDQFHLPNHQGSTRNYYDQLFSSDSEDDEFSDSSDMSISESDKSIFSSSDSIHISRNYSDKLFSSDSEYDEYNEGSDMSISDSEPTSKSNKSKKFISSPVLVPPSHITWNPSNMSISTEHSSDARFRDSESHKSYASQPSFNSNSSISTGDSLSTMEEWQDTNDTWGMAQLLEEKEKDDLLGINEVYKPPPVQEKLNNHEIDKIGSFNIQNKYDHDIAAFFMMKEDITFLSLQEPFASSNKDDKSWSTYRKYELESARICCYETPFQVILFDSWKWGGKIISPFESTHNGRATCIAFGFADNQMLGIISIYASTQECALIDKEYDKSKMSSLTIAVKKMIKNLNHQFPGICIMVMGDMQETISTTDQDNIGKFRKEYTKNGILSYLLDSHVSIVREKNHEDNYITRYGGKGGRGIDHIFFPEKFNNDNWISEAKIDKYKGSLFFPSDHSFLHCSIHRNGPNNNEDSIETRRFDFKRICNIRLQKTDLKDGQVSLSLDESQFKDCKLFQDQQKLYASIQSKTGNTSHLTKHYLDDLEKRIKFLYSELWKANIAQENDGSKNELVKIDENHAVELSHILRQFHIGIKDVMTDLECYQDCNKNRTAGTKRNKLRKEQGLHFTKGSPIQTKLRYLKIAAKINSHHLHQILTFAKDYRLRGRTSTKDFDFQHIEKTWIKIISSKKMKTQSTACYQHITEELLERENHIQAIQHERKRKNPKCKKDSDVDNCDTIKKEENMLLHTSDNMVGLINHWLHESKCDQAFNKNGEKKEETFNFLSEDYGNFLDPLLNLDIKHLIAGDAEDARNFYDTIQRALATLSRFMQKISDTQSWYKQATLDHLLGTNNISTFTSKLIHRDRSAPETHSEIWDASIQSMRPCKNEYEELIATSNYHNNWMANSKASEICAFAKIKVDGKLGFRGIELSPDRKIKEADIPNLIHNGHLLSKSMKNRFLSAHGEHTAKLFSPPKKDRPELFYPFYIQNVNGAMNEDINLINCFYKAISGIPSKARYDGYHMAVVGRFGSRWQEALLQIVKLILLMRYIPTDLKRMARFPIPKPGKKNEYRPISLCHDLYCFISGICNKYSSAGIEKANFLQESITAYREGKGCNSLVTIEQSFREDCREHNSPVVQIDEDEEKFFDRIPVEILLAAMRINGFPEQGYLEMKASAMGSKYVDIITKKGIAYAKFICGLEQGNPDSPTVANLVIKLKHDVWDYISNKAKKIFSKNNKELAGKYIFNSIDKIDGPVTLCKFGYCDDNSKYCFVKDEKDLIFLTKYFLQLAGDLSMVTKIGRKGAKSEIHFFNVSAEFAIKIKKQLSTAWSFVHDSPIEENVPVKICLKKKELQRFMELSNYQNLNQAEQESWDKIIFPKAHRHLGLTGTLSGITKETCKKTLQKMIERIKKLKIPRMHHDAQKKSFNMLCGTIHSFAPIQVGYSMKELEEVDKKFIKLVKRSRGLSSTDAKHRLFLPEKWGGMGFNSIQDTDLISTARELEILSNSAGLDSRAFRSRLAAIEKYEDENTEEYQNHAHDAVKKLAKLGIHMRDQSECMINKVFTELERLPRYQGIGSGRFKNGNGPHIGEGKQKNLDIAFGGPVHKILKILEHVNWDEKEFKKLYIKKSPVAINILIKAREKVGKAHFDELTTSLSCWEWINLDNSTNISTATDKWNFIDVGNQLKSKFPSSYWKLSDNKILDEAKKILEIDFSQRHNENDNLTNQNLQHRTVWKNIMQSTSPIFVATDGAHIKSPSKPSCKNQNKTSASFVICQIDQSEHSSKDIDNWQNRTARPLLCRTMQLPQTFGSQCSDIAHGELHAITMQEVAIPTYIPRILVTDSESVRNITIGLRDKPESNIDRKLIRTHFGGISKFLSGLLFTNINKNTISSELCKCESENSNLHANLRLLQKRNDIMLAEAIKWTKPVIDDDLEEETDTWRKEYFDDYSMRAILKVNSHQLNEAGTAMRKPSRYANLSPNISLLSMNHHADVGAEVGIKKFHVNNKPYHLCNPPSTLRYRFSWEGKTIDRHLNIFIKEKIFVERISRLKTKDTQGLLWRFIENVSVDWSDIRKHKGWLRALTGLSRTHTRSIYKSEIYREGSKNEFEYNSSNNICIPSQSTPMTIKEKIRKYSKCSWCTNHNRNILHGNRLHAILHCSHPNLSSFRKKMSNTIEQKLKALFINLQTVSNEIYITGLLNKIEKECLKLQQSNLGKSSVKPQEGISYVPISDLHKKHGVENSIQGLHKNGYFCSEAIGIIQHHTQIDVKDECLGILDSFWLGLIPKSIDSIISAAFSPYNLLNFTPNLAACKTFHSDLKQSWNAIKDLIMAKAIGLHRIIGEISKDKEKEYRKKYDLDRGTFKELKKNNEKQVIKKIAHPKKNAPLHKPNDPTHPSTPTATTINPKRTDLKNVTCKGITCNRKNQKWCLDQQFNQNKISPNLKHCQRCCNFNTAMKRSVTILEKIGNRNPSQYSKQLEQAISEALHKGINYSLLTTLLEKCQQPSGTSAAQAMIINKNNKNKILDRQKLICRIIIQTIKTTTFSEASDQNSNVFSIAANKIKVGHEQEQQYLSTRKRARTQRAINSTNTQIIDVDTDSEPTQNVKIDHPVDLSTQGNSPNASTILDKISLELKEEGQFISDDAITVAVEVLRHTTSECQDLFLANGLANITVNNWNPTLGWERFGRMFGSRIATFSKPNGLYLIPLFSGAECAGHWHLVVIQKRNRLFQGWIIDSLGSGTAGTEMHRKIESAFTTNRGRMSWNTPRSFQQVENECGPRTIKSMIAICKGVREGVSIEESINKALITSPSDRENYEPGDIRAEAIQLVRAHTCSMTTLPIRFRQRGGKIVAGRGIRRKRAPKKRRKYNANPITNLTDHSIQTTEGEKVNEIRGHNQL